MILYIDETENNEYFILTGLLFESEMVANNIYYSFKKKAANYKISEDLRAKLFTEFKSTLMDSMFQPLKKKMIEEIKTVDNVIIYSVYVKKEKSIKKSIKNKIYIRMITRIINSISDNIEIVFDRNSPDYDGNIVIAASKLDNVISIKSADSQLTPGLQLVDNICSIIRRKYSNSDMEHYYDLIEDNVREV